MRAEAAVVPLGGASGAGDPAYDAEVQVLGGLLVGEAEVRCGRATSEDIAPGYALELREFADSRHRAIYSALRGLHDRGDAVDVTTVIQELGRTAHLERAGGEPYVLDLAEATTTPATLPYHAKRVRESAQRREAVRVLRDGIARIEDGGDPEAVAAVASDLRSLHDQGRGSSRLYAMVSDLQAEELPDPEWGIDQIYPDGGFVVVFGPRGKGKTFLVLGWAFAHAAPHPWLTRSVIPGPVVYIMAEGRGGLGARVRAQKEELGVTGEAGVHFITTAVPMLDSAEVDRLIATIETLGTPPRAIVWDTLSRTFIGGDENSSKDMAQYVAAIDRVKETVGGTAIVQHHTGHGSVERERGSSVLGGAADTIVALREKDGSLEVACEKQKDGAEFTTIPVRLEQVGESCVLKLHDPAWNNGGFLSTVEFQALQTLHACALGDGLSSTAWKGASEMPDSSFYKARKSLVSRHLVDDGRGGRGALYGVTDEGARLLRLHSSTGTP